MKIKSIKKLKQFINSLPDDIQFISSGNKETLYFEFTTKKGLIVKIKLRTKEMDKDLTELFRYVDNDEYKKGKLKAEEIKNKYNDSLPEVYRAEAMLSFLIEKA